MAFSKITLNGTTLMDVTQDTVNASKVLSGEYATGPDGVRFQGTMSGGGGTPILATLRPDSELVQKWTYDKLMVQDEGKTLPSYSTSNQGVLSGGTLETYSTDLSTYSYLVAIRTLTSIIYNTTSKGSGRFDYSTSAYVLEQSYCPVNSVFSLDGTASYGTGFHLTASESYYRAGYWNSSTGWTLTSSSGGASSTPSANCVVGTITIYQPGVVLKGNTSIFNSTYWGYMTDIRHQYVVELWRTPLTPFKGWQTSQLAHVFNCVKNNGGTLT